MVGLKVLLVSKRKCRSLIKVSQRQRSEAPRAVCAAADAADDDDDDDDASTVVYIEKVLSSRARWRMINVIPKSLPSA